MSRNDPPWRESELQAGRIYGKCVPASGAIKELGKSDIIGLGKYQGLRGENKWTPMESRSVKLKELRKIMFEAIQSGCEDGFFRIDFNGQVFIVVREDYFRSLHE